MSISDYAVIISGIALFISVVSLWVNNFAPFKLKVLHNTPKFSLYKITPDVSGDETKKTWWIPSFDVGMTFYNTGKRSGEVLDIRIVAEFKGFRSSKKYIFYPKWVVNYASFNRNRTERFEWIEKSIERDWYSILLKGQTEMCLHVVLETDRWEHKENGSMSFCLEVVSSKKKNWIECGRYMLGISNEMFEEKSSYSPSDLKIEKLRTL